ncbi:DNA adenine methylase [Patescibacteria group bacterium]|nr:DNA adenine methylase [Patescibacteria group bacterium]
MSFIVSAKPFIKWVGGKSQLLSQLEPYFPEKFGTYFEPFLGGGAVFYHLQPKKAVLNDINETLVQTYLYIKNEPSKLIKQLDALQKKYISTSTEERENFYYDIRSKYNKLPLSDSKRVIYFLFLNRTAFNGIHRENSKGEFNVPAGRYKNPRIVDPENLKAVSEMLQNVEILNSDFVSAVKKAKKGDFVYFDPPYHPLNDAPSFTSYHKNSFGKEEQAKLRDTFVELDKKGVYVMMSNSYTPFIKELYSDYRQLPVQASRMINARASGRGKINEIVVLNY